MIVYSLKVEQAPGNLRLLRQFTVDMLLLDPKYYSQLRNFYQVVRTDDALDYCAAGKSMPVTRDFGSVFVRRRASWDFWSGDICADDRAPGRCRGCAAVDAEPGWSFVARL